MKIDRSTASLVVAMTLLMWPGSVAPSAASTGHAARPVGRLERLIFRGETAPVKIMPTRSGAGVVAPRVRRPLLVRRPIDNHRAARRSAPSPAAAIPVPVGPNLPVVAATRNFPGFAGLTDVDQFNAGTGAYANTQIELEPPDQGLCAGNGFVVEAVNNAFAVYNPVGTRLIAPTALNQFFKLAPEISQTNAYGPFVYSPTCYFDRDTQHWFISVLEIDANPVNGFLYNSRHSALLLAVSQTGDPTGGYRVYAVDTSNASVSCGPCFSDRALLGADANGLFVTTDASFSLGPNASGVAQIYAFAKNELAKGTLPAIVHIDLLAFNTIDNNWSSIQPATAPDTSAANRIGNGTEFFLSALDAAHQGDNRIAVWAVTNTQSLHTALPNLGIQHTIIQSEAYATAPPAAQKIGPAPLAAALRSPLEKLDTPDDRMSQVVFAGGRLWSALTTAMRSGSGVDAGIAFFAVAPAFDQAGVLAAKMQQQRYFAVAGQNLMLPAVGVNAAGGAVIAATLTGPLYYPTAVYIPPDGMVHIAGPGAGPDDGFSGYGLLLGYGDINGYEPFGGFTGVGRWGTYSAAVADNDGSIWFATQYTSGQRTTWSNWGTFIGHLAVH